MKWKILSTEYLYKHPPYFIARKDVCERPDGVVIPAYYVVEMPPAVMVFGLTEHNDVLMIKQFRHPINEVSLELPGGLVDEHEDLELAAKRETEEETGYVFSNYIYLGKTAANPGILNNYTHLFLATGGKPEGKLDLDHNEEIKVELVSLEKLTGLLEERKIVQSLHTNACFYALLHLQKLKFSL